MGRRKEKKNRLAAAPGSPQPPCHRCKGQMLIDWRGGFGCRLFLFPPESGDQLWLATGRDKCRLAQPALPGASLPLPTLSLRMEPAPRSLGWAGGSQRVSLGKRGSGMAAGHHQPIGKLQQPPSPCLSGMLTPRGVITPCIVTQSLPFVHSSYFMVTSWKEARMALEGDGAAQAGFGHCWAEAAPCCSSGLAKDRGGKQIRKT